jgi:hypothetical protein
LGHFDVSKQTIDFWILPYETTSGQPQPVKDRQKYRPQILVRYVPSGTYYARLRVKGKFIVRSLKTDVLPVPNCA